MVDVDKTIKNYGYVNFKPAEKEEEWSVYELEDGTILKLKATPLKFLKKGDTVLVNPMFLVVPFASPEARESVQSRKIVTPEFPLTETEMKDQIIKPNMDFKVVQEPWNEYELDDGSQYSMRIVAVIISSTKLQDAGEEPIYLVNHSLLTKKGPKS